MEQKLIDFLIRFRNPLALLSLVVTAIIAWGAQGLYFQTDYKIYFQADDPQLLMHELVEDTYTNSDNLAIMLRPKTGDVFNERIINLIYDLTEQGWQVPYAMRVDSITNFQHTKADDDDLLVEDILLEPGSISAPKLAEIRSIVLGEKQLYRRLVSQDGTTSLININLELPPEVDPLADQATQTEQRLLRDSSYVEVTEYGRELIKTIQAEYPDIEMHLNGVTIINNAFNEVGQQDAQNLLPLMYIIILVALTIFLRSLGGVVATLVVIASASAAAVGSAGWIGYALNAVNITTPTIVLTIAVCDAVHLLTIYLRGLARDMDRFEAMREALRLNLQPIVLTSVTTAVGFLTLNFSVSPPFGELGNMTAFGVLWAMVLTFTLLPALGMLLIRKRKPAGHKKNALMRYADWVIENRKLAFFGSGATAIALMCMIPLNIINDDPITYFKKGLEYRASMDFASDHLPGINDINMSIDCGEPSCVSQPDFLAMLDEFQAWALAQPEVVQVSSYADVIKRLNRSMNADDPSFYRVPESAEMAAQYNLMYEMSLPFGLDLNNQLNLDKSATKVTILVERVTSSGLIEVSERAHQWLRDNFQAQANPPSGVNLMFSHMGEKNIRSMLVGAIYAIIGVTITILIALRSFRYAAISMVPNAIPAFMAFGVWGLLVGTVNMAVAVVFSISLGILVDDTVHFISKYRRARLVKDLTPEDSIRYAFDHVGAALIITTLVLCIGFGVLATSDFAVNSMAGSLTAITIFIALVFDFLILPPLLMFFDSQDSSAA